jgi:hypothetical protein
MEHEVNANPDPMCVGSGQAPSHGNAEFLPSAVTLTVRSVRDPTPYPYARERLHSPCLELHQKWETALQYPSAVPNWGHNAP